MSETHKTISLQEWRDTYRGLGWKLVQIYDNGTCAVKQDNRTYWDRQEMYPSQRKDFYKKQAETDPSFASAFRLPDNWDQEQMEREGKDIRKPESILSEELKYPEIFSKRKMDAKK